MPLGEKGTSPKMQPDWATDKEALSSIERDLSPYVSCRKGPSAAMCHDGYMYEISLFRGIQQQMKLMASCMDCRLYGSIWLVILKHRDLA